MYTLHITYITWHFLPSAGAPVSQALPFHQFQRCRAISGKRVAAAAAPDVRKGARAHSSLLAALILSVCYS